MLGCWATVNKGLCASENTVWVRLLAIVATSPLPTGPGQSYIQLSRLLPLSLARAPALVDLELVDAHLKLKDSDEPACVLYYTRLGRDISPIPNSSLLGARARTHVAPSPSPWPTLLGGQKARSAHCCSFHVRKRGGEKAHCPG